MFIFTVLKILCAVGTLINASQGALTWTKPNTNSGEVSVTVDESVAAGSSTGIELEVTGVTGTVTYTITQQTNPDQFGIGDGANSKVITLATGTLDYDTSPVPSYVVTVEAVDTDVGSTQTATVTITINISDDNDNPPVFAESTYQFTIPDGSDIGTTLGTVTATDKDGTQANNVIDSYDFTAGNTNEDFAVSDAGQITTAKELDKTRTASYELILIATDSGDTALTGTTTVSVTVGEDEGNSGGGDNGNGGSTGGGDDGGGDTGGGDNGNGGDTGGGDSGDNGNGGDTGGGDNGNGGDTGGGDGNDGGNGDGGDNGKSGATAVFANIMFVLLIDFIVVVLIGV